MRRHLLIGALLLGVPALASSGWLDGWGTSSRIEGTPDSTTFLRGDGAWATPPAGEGGGGPTYVRVATSDYTNATTNPTNIPRLAISVTAGTVYSFGCELFSASSAATVGVRPGFTFPAVNHFRATCQIPASASALAWFNVTATGQSCDATASQGTGVAQIFISGTIEASASGTLQVQGEAETTGTITIHRGSKCWAIAH